MKRLILLLCVSACVALSGTASAQSPKPVSDASLGLSKGSVFDVPTPQPFAADGKGASGSAKAAYGAPPLVPHPVDEFLPISAAKNDCTGCHDRPGAKKAKGEPTAMPPLHYVKGEAKPRLSGDYYNCALCHAPAADVKDIVVNKAPKPAR